MALLESRKNHRRKGQSIIELLIGITIGGVLIVAATAAIAPSLRSNTQTQKIQTSATLGKELLDNLKTWSDSNWNSLLALATGTSYRYYLNTSSSPFTVAIGSESITIASGTAATSSLTSGLVGYWPMDEGAGTVASDFSGNGNDGSWSGGTPSYVGGKVGKSALNFAGSSTGYVNVGNNSVLNLAGSFSLALWVKTNNSGADALVSKLTGPPYDGWAFRIESGGKLGVYMKTWIAGSASVGDQSWHHVAFVFTASGASGSGQFYIDGKPDSSLQSGLTTPTQTSQNVWIGVETWGPTEYPANATLDDVRIYNRALSASEMAQLYNSGQSSVTYNRYFSLSDVYRDGSGNVVTSGGGYDPSSKQATVVYGWANGTTNSMSTILTRTRNAVFSQNDWSGGPGQNGAMTSTNNQFATSSNIDYTTTTGAIYLAIPGY